MAQETLAQHVRAKYPGAYDDLTDEQLESSVLAKHPEYSDLPRSVPEPEVRDDEGVAPWVQVLMDLAQGFGKGAANTAIGLGDLAGRASTPFAPGLTLNKLTGATPETFASARKAFATPENTAQKIGSGAEQIAEFFLPAGMAGRGAAAAAKFMPKALARAGTEALSAGAVTAAQGGHPLTAAATAGVFPIAGKLAGSVAGPVAKRLRGKAVEQVVQALGPTKERFKAMAEKRAPELLKRGFVGSREALEAKARDATRVAGEQIDEALKQFAAQPVSVKPIVEALESAKAPFLDTTGSGLPVALDTRAVNQLSSLQNTIEKYGAEISVESLVKVRRAWDAVVSQAGGYAHRGGGAIGIPLKEQSEAWAKREGANAIRRVLAEDVPELAALNKEFAFWKDVRDVVGQTLKRTKPQEKGLVEKIVGTGAGGGVLGGTLAHGTAILPAASMALVAGVAAKNLVRAFKSPRWKTLSAQTKSRLADALESGNPERINLAVGRVVAATTGRQ